MLFRSIENYSVNGVTDTDGVPVAVYLYNSPTTWINGYAANMAEGKTNLDAWVVQTNGAHGAPWQTMLHKTGTPEFTGIVKSRINKTITVNIPGGSVGYDFETVCDYSDVPGALQEGFFGTLFVVLLRRLDYSAYSRSAYLIGTHRAGASSWQPMTKQIIGVVDDTFDPGYEATINPVFIDGTLEIQIAWGANWSSSDTFELTIGLVGTTVRSA